MTAIPGSLSRLPGELIDVVRRDRANGCLFRSPAEALAQEFKRTEESPAIEKKSIP